MGLPEELRAALGREALEARIARAGLLLEGDQKICGDQGRSERRQPSQT
jgi:hypothetical protein